MLVVVLGAYLFITFKKTPASTDPAVYATVGQSVNPDTLPVIRTRAAPWFSGEAQLQARLHAIGLQALGSEGTALHIHQHLDLYIDGARVTVPAKHRDRFGLPVRRPYPDTSGVIAAPHVEELAEREGALSG